MNLIAHIIFHFFVQITRDGRTVKKQRRGKSKRESWAYRNGCPVQRSGVRDTQLSFLDWCRSDNIATHDRWHCSHADNITHSSHSWLLATYNAQGSPCHTLNFYTWHSTWRDTAGVKKFPEQLSILNQNVCPYCTILFINFIYFSTAKFMPDCKFY